jgi:hypothetical protein
MPMVPITDEVQNAVTASILPPVCTFAWRDNKDEGNGSGTIIERGGEHYILTCAHVAEPFLRCRQIARILFPGGSHAERCTVRLAYLDAQDDLAILRYYGPVNTTEGLGRLERSPDLDPLYLQDFGGAFCGMPWDLANIGVTKWEFKPLSFLADVSSSKPRLVWCDYPSGLGHVTALSKLPHPGGISGSLLWLVHEFPPSQKTIWNPQDLRAVGVLREYFSSLDRVEAISLERLPDWFWDETIHPYFQNLPLS